MKEDCIFCKIICKDISSYVIYEDERFAAILDINPASKGHVLILTKEHYANIWELPEDIAADSIKLAKRLSAGMRESLKCDGVNLVQNNGSAAGQTVFHYHVHLIPRYEGEAGIVVWPPGTSTQEELAAVQRILMGKL